MSLAGFVTGDDISRLSKEEFPKVMNTLLTVEASIHNVPITDLDLTTRVNDPDGGVDALMRWPSGVTNEFFQAGKTALQYKSGKLPARELRKEFKKRGVQECLREGGHYIVLVGHDYTPPWTEKLRGELRKLCTSKGFDPRKCKLIVGGHIAAWVSRYPAVIMIPELGKNLPAFLTVGEWRSLQSFRNPWKPDQARLDIIRKIRTLLRAGVQDPVVRIEGPREREKHDSP